jgi:hypothetical protein
MNDYKSAARRARSLLYAAKQPDRELVLAACRTARDLAPDDMHARHWARFIDMLSAGRTLRTKTYAIDAISVDGTDIELVREIEAALEGVE